MTNADIRYDEFGWDYELQNSPPAAEEVRWYLRWARQSGGPVLALACGTGRLACRLAEAGFQTVGMDISPTMFALARRNQEAMEEDARQRLELVQGDMADFCFDRTFGLILIADNSFRELSDTAGLVKCLSCMRRNLAPGGRILLAERRFDPTRFPRGRRTWDWSSPCRHPVTGDAVCRRVEVELSPDGRRVHGVVTYKITASNGTESITPCPFEAPVLHTGDYLSMFAEAGLVAEVYSDYTDRSADSRETMSCFVCRTEE